MTPTPWRRRPPVLAARALGVLALGAVIIGLNVPRDWQGEALGAWTSAVSRALRTVSFVQSWKMYAPNPQRAQTYMNLTAHYEDGTERELEETLQERAGWRTHFAWDKTREDIWRHYANFNPKRSSDHRKWYLRGVCVREARTGRVPSKIVMDHVTRRFAPPGKVAAGMRGLGEPRSRLVTVVYCRADQVRAMIEADQARGAG